MSVGQVVLAEYIFVFAYISIQVSNDDKSVVLKNVSDKGR